jgi:carbamoyltransferase
MYVLGIKPFGHDTAACLIHDKNILAASSQERFDRKIHSSAFPFDAIKFCLDVASVNINQVDEIAISYNYKEAILKLFFFTNIYIFSSIDIVLKRFYKSYYNGT